jgi:hypothetical protein
LAELGVKARRRSPTKRRALVIKASQTCGRLGQPAFQQPTGEIPTPPSDHIPLWRRCAFRKGINLTHSSMDDDKMIDQHVARLRTHRRNIQRYRNLLQTSLTDLERQFVQKRLTEEQSNLESLANSLPNDFGGLKAGRPGLA